MALVNGVERGYSATGTLAVTGAGDWANPNGPFNLALSGTWVGSVALEASFDDGTTVVPVLTAAGSPLALSQNGLVVIPDVIEPGTLFRVSFTRTSGTLSWRISR